MATMRPVLAWIISGPFRTHALAVAGGLALVVATACVSVGPAKVEPSDLELSFPVLARLGVTAYRDQDWCKVLAYARGSFSETTEHSTCDLFQGRPSKFDSQAQADLEQVRAALIERGIVPSYVTVEYLNGAVQTAVFEVGCAGCGIGRYIYESGGVPANTELGPGSSQVILSPHWTWYEER
jgi:hypothetical protein